MQVQPDSVERRRSPLAGHPRVAVFLALLSIGNTPTAEAAPATVEAAPARPNVLIVLTDDQGYGDVGSHGNVALSTPWLDQLASSGARFDRFYVSPVCAPTRASLLTGRWHLRTGVHGVTRGHETMRSQEVTIAEIFQDAGYATAAVGKWHNGAHFPEHPLGQGFDTFFGFCGGHFNNYFDARLEHDGRAEPFSGYVADRLTDHAIEFIQSNRDAPWFCYVAYNTPHTPWQVPDEYWRRTAERSELPDDQARCAAAMVENLDTNVGRMLTSLDRLELSSNTIVVFLTDNGLNSDRYNAGMRGRKGSLHEGGSRVPCFVRWPAVIPAGQRVEPIAAHVDLLPTLCDLAAVAVPQNIQIDGVSLRPLLTESARPWPARRLFTHWGDDAEGRPRPDRGAVRTDRWRAVQENDRWQLYDMLADPSETSDVANAHPHLVAELASEFDQWFAEVTADGFEPQPIQVGHAESIQVTLPGHEARLESAANATDGIGYVGKSGWANDWITQWTDPAASAWWPLSVRRSGDYDIEIEYAANAPCQLIVTAGQETHTFPLQAAAAEMIPSPDRIPRKEVVERRWATAHLGSLPLSGGAQRLTVRWAVDNDQHDDTARTGHTARARQPGGETPGLEIKSVTLRYRLPKPDRRPSVVVFMVDDMGFSDIGCYGGEAHTPRLDQLARQGMRFTSFYNNAKCEPTRASLLTGQYPQIAGAGARVAYRVPTFGEMLREAGYRTWMAGKWHAAESPHERGFDRHFGLTDGCCNFFNPGLPRPGEPAPSHKSFPRRWAVDDRGYQPYHPARRDFYTTDAFTDHALAYLDQYGRQPEPFVLYVAYTAPHYPLHAPAELVDKYLDRYRAGWESLRAERYRRFVDTGPFATPPALSPPDPRSPDWDQLSPDEQQDWLRRMAVYAAMIERVDWNVGRVLDKLAEVGRERNTLVLFFSDNGGEADGSDWSRERGAPAGPVDSFRTVGQPWANVSNVPFRMYKTCNHEGGIASPLIARWPERIVPDSVSNQVAHLIDVVPTLLDLAEAEYPQMFQEQKLAPLPGISLLPMLQDGSLDQPRTLYWQWNQGGAIRAGDWKLVRGTWRGKQQTPWELYRMDQDRSELKDLAKMHPDQVAKLAAQWEAWQRQEPGKRAVSPKGESAASDF